MTDITKARKYLSMRNSDMQHFTSFGLMYNSAKSRYKEIQLKKKTGREDFPGSLDAQEAYALLDLAVLAYLNKTNRLPTDLGNIFIGNKSPEEIREVATKWINQV